MGDAKRRGTFEERKVASIARQKIESEQRIARKREMEAAKTPEQRLKERKAKMEYIQLMSMLAGWRYYNPFHKFPLVK